MSLRDHCHRLTYDHLTHGPDGQPATVPALLDQLDEAVSPNMDGGSATGTPIPINAEAIDLKRRIDREAREYQSELIGVGTGTLKGIIRSWSVESVNAEWQAYLEHVTLEWIDAIDGLLRPTKPPRKLTLPCPSCGVLYHEGKAAMRVHCWDTEGEFLKIGLWCAECAACGAEWAAGEQMTWLIHAIHSNSV